MSVEAQNEAGRGQLHLDVGLPGKLGMRNTRVSEEQGRQMFRIRIAVVLVMIIIIVIAVFEIVGAIVVVEIITLGARTFALLLFGVVVVVGGGGIVLCEKHVDELKKR